MCATWGAWDPGEFSGLFSFIWCFWMHCAHECSQFSNIHSYWRKCVNQLILCDSEYWWETSQVQRATRLLVWISINDDNSKLIHSAYFIWQLWELFSASTLWACHPLTQSRMGMASVMPCSIHVICMQNTSQDCCNPKDQAHLSNPLHPCMWSRVTMAGLSLMPVSTAVNVQGCVLSLVSLIGLHPELLWNPSTFAHIYLHLLPLIISCSLSLQTFFNFNAEYMLLQWGTVLPFSRSSHQMFCTAPHIPGHWCHCHGRPWVCHGWPPASK